MAALGLSPGVAFALVPKGRLVPGDSPCAGIIYYAGTETEYNTFSPS